MLLSTEDASDPVIIEGAARFVTDPVVLQHVIDLINAKYRSGLSVDFLDPEKNADDRSPSSASVQRVAQRLHGLADPVGFR